MDINILYFIFYLYIHTNYKDMLYFIAIVLKDRQRTRNLCSTRFNNWALIYLVDCIGLIYYENFYNYIYPIIIISRIFLINNLFIDLEELV